MKRLLNWLRDREDIILFAFVISACLFVFYLLARLILRSVVG